MRIWSGLTTLKRELKEMEDTINEITSGKLPLKVMYYVMFSEISESRFMAQELAVSGIKEISNAFDSVIRTKSSIVYGSDLVNALKFDSSIVVS